MNKKLLSLLSIFLLVLSLPMAAQQRKFRIVEFYEDPTDITASEVGKRDANGDVYAIVKVTASGAEDKLAAYRFNFGMANSIVDSSRGDELWVYVQRNATRKKFSS